MQRTLQDHLFDLGAGIAGSIVSKEASRCSIICITLKQALQGQLLPLYFIRDIIDKKYYESVINVVNWIF